MAKVTQKHVEEADKFYVANYQGRLSIDGKAPGPKTIAKVKELMAQAKANGEKMAKAARAYFKERNVAVAEKSDTAAVTAPKSDGKPAAAPAEKAAKAEVVRTTETAQNEIKRRLQVIEHLAKAGVSIVAPKPEKTTLDGLRELLTKGMRELEEANPKAMKEHARINIGAMEEQRVECIGVLPLMDSISCDSCSFKPECVRQYIINVKSNFSKLDALKVGASNGAAAAAAEEQPAKEETKPAKAPKAEKAAPAAKPKKGALDAAWTVQVNSYDKPDEAGEEFTKANADETEYAMLTAILKEVPETVGDLRAIVDRLFDGVDDKAFASMVKQLEEAAFIMVDRG